MTIAFPPLPFEEADLEPHMSAETIGFHYGKHHRSYVEKLNDAIESTELANDSLEEIIKATAADRSQAGIFNKAAQAWNHEFFWDCITPGGDTLPKGALAEAITKTFGDQDGFNDAFKEAAAGRFGSGWVWLVDAAGTLEIKSTANAWNPMVEDQTPLLTCDVWEHAYYLDYQNRKAKFVEVFLGKLVNWSFVAENLSRLR